MVHLHLTNTEWLIHTALGIVLEAPDLFEAADQLKEWVEGWIGNYLDECQEKTIDQTKTYSYLWQGAHSLLVDMVHVQLDGVNWERIAQVLRERT